MEHVIHYSLDVEQAVNKKFPNQSSNREWPPRCPDTAAFVLGRCLNTFCKLKIFK